MKKITNFKTRIYYDNTDAGGVVYHSKYLDICERARTEFLREKNINQIELIEKDEIFFVVKSANIEYKKPAKLDDLIEVKTNILENNGLIIKINQEIILVERQNNTENNILLFTMTCNLVMINNKGIPIRIPKEINNIINN